MDTIGAICYMITQKQQTLQILLKDLEEYEYGNLNLHIRTGSSDIVVCNDNFKEPYWKHLVPGDYWLDLGGYVGSSALVFLRAGAKHVFSVDADPVHVMLYKNNLELNGYDPDILCAAIVGRRTRSIQDFFYIASHGQDLHPQKIHVSHQLLEIPMQKIPHNHPNPANNHQELDASSMAL